MKKLITVALTLLLAFTLFTGCEEVTSTKIEIAEQPANVVFGMGEELSVQGARLRVYHGDASSEVIDVTDDMLVNLSSIDMNTLGEKQVTVRYEGLTTTITIYVANRVGTEEELKEALAAGGYIALSADIETGSRFDITCSVTLLGGGHKLISTENLSSNQGILLAKDVENVSLTVKNCVIQGQKIVGISYENTTGFQLNVSDCEISTLRYGIHSRGSKDTEVSITDCTINSWGCYYARASQDETVTITGSALLGTNIYSGDSNGFANISIQYGGGNPAMPSKNITVNVNDSTMFAITRTENSQKILSVVSSETAVNENAKVYFTNTECFIDGHKIKTTDEDFEPAYCYQDWGLYNDGANDGTPTLVGHEFRVDGKLINPSINTK